MTRRDAIDGRMSPKIHPSSAAKAAYNQTKSLKRKQLKEMHPSWTTRQIELEVERYMDEKYKPRPAQQAVFFSTLPVKFTGKLAIPQNIPGMAFFKNKTLRVKFTGKVQKKIPAVLYG